MPSQPLTKAQRMSYRIGRGETGVLTFLPYKTELLPLWRFKTASLARQSSSAIYAAFLAYDAADDFIGMDMSRKFLQMGMTRAKRYANHKGGRKYDKGTGEELPAGEEFEGRREKEEASGVFRGVWERAKRHGGYVEKKERFVVEQREWDRARVKVKVKEDDKAEVKEDDGVVVNEDDKMNMKEEDGEAETKPKKTRRQVKTAIEADKVKTKMTQNKVTPKLKKKTNQDCS